jgi:hypothetical protein
VATGRRRAPPPPRARKVPVAATTVIADARDATAKRDFKRLQTLLLDRKDVTFFKIGDNDVIAARAAIDAWRSQPAMLKRLDAALAAACDLEGTDEGDLVTCGGLADRDPMVQLARIDGTGAFKIIAFDSDVLLGRATPSKARVLETEVEVDEAD